MKFAIVLLLMTLSGSAVYAADPCADAGATGQTPCTESTNRAGAESVSLPQDAHARVEKLRIDLRYMRATGHPAEAEKKKEAITAIYQEHGVPLPDGFDSW